MNRTPVQDPRYLSPHAAHQAMEKRLNSYAARTDTSRTILPAAERFSGQNVNVSRANSIAGPFNRADNPFGDEHKIENWTCPKCGGKKVASSERLENLDRNGRYYFACEVIRCGADLVAKKGEFDAAGERVRDHGISPELMKGAVQIEEDEWPSQEPGLNPESTVSTETASLDQKKGGNIFRRAKRALGNRIERWQQDQWYLTFEQFHTERVESERGQRGSRHWKRTDKSKSDSSRRTRSTSGKDGQASASKQIREAGERKDWRCPYCHAWVIDCDILRWHIKYYHDVEGF